MQLTKKQQDSVLKSVNNYTLLDDVNYKGNYNYTFKDEFFSAVMCRISSKLTQQQVADMFDVTKKTIIELEKGKSNNLKLVLNYIHKFKSDLRSNKRKGYLNV